VQAHDFYSPERRPINYPTHLFICLGCDKCQNLPANGHVWPSTIDWIDADSKFVDAIENLGVAIPKFSIR
jgi:hypothetical protein